ncbi:MAG: hypothetical protein IJC37_04635 [Clostridia bacterium]|nr:hypothetical protein [Clostridia bacterium]
MKNYGLIIAQGKQYFHKNIKAFSDGIPSYGLPPAAELKTAAGKVGFIAFDLLFKAALTNLNYSCFDKFDSKPLRKKSFNTDRKSWLNRRAS